MSVAGSSQPGFRITDSPGMIHVYFVLVPPRGFEYFSETIIHGLSHPLPPSPVARGCCTDTPWTSYCCVCPSSPSSPPALCENDHMLFACPSYNAKRVADDVVRNERDRSRTKEDRLRATYRAKREADAEHARLRGMRTAVAALTRNGQRHLHNQQFHANARSTKMADKTTITTRTAKPDTRAAAHLNAAYAPSVLEQWEDEPMDSSDEEMAEVLESLYVSSGESADSGAEVEQEAAAAIRRTEAKRMVHPKNGGTGRKRI